MDNQKEQRKPKKFIYTEAKDKRAKRDRERLLSLKKIVSDAHKITSQIRK